MWKKSERKQKDVWQKEKDGRERTGAQRKRRRRRKATTSLVGEEGLGDPLGLHGLFGGVAVLVAGLIGAALFFVGVGVGHAALLGVAVGLGGHLVAALGVVGLLGAGGVLDDVEVEVEAAEEGGVGGLAGREELEGLADFGFGGVDVALGLVEVASVGVVARGVEGGGHVEPGDLGRDVRGRAVRGDVVAEAHGRRRRRGRHLARDGVHVPQRELDRDLLFRRGPFDLDDDVALFFLVDVAQVDGVVGVVELGEARGVAADASDLSVLHFDVQHGGLRDDGEQAAEAVREGADDAVGRIHEVVAALAVALGELLQQFRVRVRAVAERKHRRRRLRKFVEHVPQRRHERVGVRDAHVRDAVRQQQQRPHALF
mmetsp:Transcript_19365/g.59787  ORF Transcript_19365/g.59787 Transcript_19365/m.59787 type:complete len:371 (+) Transcript_19365:2116-3228(+)